MICGSIFLALNTCNKTTLDSALVKIQIGCQAPFLKWCKSGVK